MRRPSMKNPTGDVPTTNIRMWSCPRCCCVTNNGDWIGNRPSSDDPDMEESMRSARGEICRDLPEFEIPRAKWIRHKVESAPMLPKYEACDDWMCLLDAMESIYLHHRTHICGDASRFDDDVAERGIRRWMEILESFLRMQRKEARQSHDPSVMEVPWAILRMIVSFTNVNLDIVEVRESGVVAVAQIGTYVRGAQTYELVCARRTKSHSGFASWEGHCVGVIPRDRTRRAICP